jgi:hypothetical protein
LLAFKPLQADALLKAGNTLTQRALRTSSNAVTIKLDLGGLVDGQQAGLCHFSRTSSALGVSQAGAVRTLEYRANDRRTSGPVLTTRELWLRSTWSLEGVSQYSYSLDGATFTSFGEPYQLGWGNYRGDRIGIYNFNTEADAGHLDVDWFRYDYAGQKNR